MAIEEKIIIIVILAIGLWLADFIFISGPQKEIKLMNECIASGENTHFECKAMVNAIVWKE